MLNAAYECSAKGSHVSRFYWHSLSYYRDSSTPFLPFLQTFYYTAPYVRRLRTYGVGASHAWSCVLNILQSTVRISVDCNQENHYIIP